MGACVSTGQISPAKEAFAAGDPCDRGDGIRPAKARGNGGDDNFAAPRDAALSLKTRSSNSLGPRGSTGVRHEAACQTLDTLRNLHESKATIDPAVMQRSLIAVASSDFIARLTPLASIDFLGAPTKSACGLTAGENGLETVEAVKCLIDHLIFPVTRLSLDVAREEADAATEPLGLPNATRYADAACEKTLLPGPALRSVVRMLLTVLGWLCELLRESIPEDLFYVDSVNHVFSAAEGTLVRPSSGIASVRQLKGLLDQFSAFLLAFGVIPHEEVMAASPSDCVTDDDELYAWMAELPLFALNTSSKRSLLYISTNREQKKLSLHSIRRHCVLADAQARANSVWAGVPSSAYRMSRREVESAKASKAPGFFKIFPAFASGDSNATVEYGEGHGPRKEYFDLVADALTSNWSADADLHQQCSATLERDSSTASIRPLGPARGKSGKGLKQAALLPEIPLWSRLTFRGLPGDVATFEAEVQQVTRETGVDGAVTGYIVKLSEPSPAACPNASLSLKRQAVPLFQKDPAGATWFKDHGDFSTPPTGRERELLDSYGFAGWTVAQAAANGVTINLGLPPVFFNLLRAWPEYAPTVADLHGVYPEMAGRVKSMPREKLRELLITDELPEDTSAEGYLEHRAETVLCDDIYSQMCAFSWGFHSTGMASVFPYKQCSARELSLMLQGRYDDGTSDFSVRDEFRVVEADDFAGAEHNKLFRQVLWDVIDEGFGVGKADKAERKRQFIRFLTGRSLLPAHPQQEPIFIVLPYTVFAARDFDSSLLRLPVSHTCDNVLELPNYMEALMFGSTSPWYDRKGAKLNSAVTVYDKKACWSVLTEEEKVATCERLRDVLRDRFTAAILNSASYELDYNELDGGAAAASGDPERTDDEESSSHRSDPPTGSESSEVALPAEQAPDELFMDAGGAGLPSLGDAASDGKSRHGSMEAEGPSEQLPASGDVLAKADPSTQKAGPSQRPALHSSTNSGDGRDAGGPVPLDAQRGGPAPKFKRSGLLSPVGLDDSGTPQTDPPPNPRVSRIIHPPTHPPLSKTNSQVSSPSPVHREAPTGGRQKRTSDPWDTQDLDSLLERLHVQ
ncbi:E3 ubiquitin-protein ligase RSP5 [Diplonema papillatum]|nr:E3 ubiquitin-protein ligase RSP5 [Diplonema papillatum]